MRWLPALVCVVMVASWPRAVSEEQCGGGECVDSGAHIRIVSPTEGGQLFPDTVAGAVKIEAAGPFAKVALYLNGNFVSATPLQSDAGSVVQRASLRLPLPGGAQACGRWHFVEAALMDDDDWRIESPGAEAVVRFTQGCVGSLAEVAAAAQTAAAEAKARERAGAFETIYDEFGWEPTADGSKETRSGPGSYLARTNASRAFLAGVLRDFKVSTVLDAGCGDVNWQGHTPGIDAVDYVGVDIVPQMIADNERRLGGPGSRMRFAVKDVVKDDLGGPYDVILCRDTLFHLPLWDAVQVCVCVCVCVCVSE